MATFTFAARPANYKPEPKAPGKPRGKNPPGARTKNEPPRVAPLPYRDELPGLNYRKPGADALPDSLDLRRRVAEATLEVAKAHDAYTNAIEAFKAIGDLPDSIIQDLPSSMRRHLSLYKQTKLAPPEVPWTVIKRVPSATREGLAHEIREDRLYQLSCTCEGYKFNGRCWALDDVRATREAREEKRAKKAAKKGDEE